jgi:type II secretion system protein N
MNPVEQELPSSEIPTKSFSLLSKIGLSFSFIGLLILFTILKLPQTKITSLIQGVVQSQLDPFGIYITDHGRELSIWKGFEYRLIQPVLELPDMSRVELEEIVVSPKLLSLLTGKAGAKIEITQVVEKSPAKTDLSKIEMDASFGGDFIDASIDLHSLDLGKFGILAFAAGLKGTGVLNGNLHVKGHLADLTSLSGNIDLKLSKLRIEEGKVFFLSIPTILVSDGTIDGKIENGKIAIKKFQIGKPVDDLDIGVTGDMTLNRNINSSVMNLRASIGLSEKVKQKLSMLDAVMGEAKQPDGKYVYRLTGTLQNRNVIPESKK